MEGTVWCVFQRLPNEKCPSLAAVCRSRAVADALCESSRREGVAAGEPASDWTVQEWTVLDRSAERRAERADQISHVLDPMRAGAVPSFGEGDDENPE
jgi:hypothetical protein